MLEKGMLLDGRYRILAKIAQGGMSNIYLAVNEKAGKEWVIKEVRKEGIEDNRIFRQSLLMEVTFLRELHHPHLPDIVDVLEDNDRLLIVMEYISGMTLAMRLRKEGRLSQQEVVRIGIQLCETLSYLHNQKPPIIYRDMKPGNIMLREDDSVVLIDFGTARRYDNRKSGDTLPLGTRGYAAPEQFLDERQLQSDARTDIYNLGATLYHAVTGHNPCLPPYQVGPIRSWNPALSSGLEAIITKCTKADPAERFTSAREVRTALLHYRRLDEEEYIRDKKRLSFFFLMLFLWMTGGILMCIGYQGMSRENNRIYYDILAQAGLKAAAFSLTEADEEEIISLYQKAIKMVPENQEAYIQLLDFYLQGGEGQTAPAISTLSVLISLYQKQLKDKDELIRRLAFLSFEGSYGDTGFQPDYLKASYFFSQLNSKKYPQAKLYESISKALSKLEVDWPEILADLNALAGYFPAAAAEKNIDHYLLLANLLISNSRVLSEYMENPLERGRQYLEQAREEMENPYYDKQVRGKYGRRIYTSLAEICYRQGMLAADQESQSSFLLTALYYYEILLTEFAYEKDRGDLLNQMAGIYVIREEYKSAAQLYENILEAYPADARAYADYGMMVLLGEKDEKKALRLYEEGLMSSPASEHHYLLPLANRLQLVLGEGKNKEGETGDEF